MYKLCVELRGFYLKVGAAATLSLPGGCCADLPMAARL